MSKIDFYTDQSSSTTNITYELQRALGKRADSLVKLRHDVC